VISIYFQKIRAKKRGGWGAKTQKIGLNYF